MTEDIPVIKNDNPSTKDTSDNVSTIFSDSRLVDVLINEKIVWEYILKGESDPQIREDIEDIISRIKDFEKRKIQQLTEKDLKERLGSSANNATGK